MAEDELSVFVENLTWVALKGRREPRSCRLVSTLPHVHLRLMVLCTASESPGHKLTLPV